jgi:hypothetical protein
MSVSTTCKGCGLEFTAREQVLAIIRKRLATPQD